MRALLVEDEAVLRESLKARLVEAGFTVDVAQDGEEGVFAGLEYPLDVAIIDLGLPKLPGLEVIRRLRADDPTRPFGDALIDQRTIAGLGNIWKSESCFAAAADPWKPAGRTADETVIATIRFAREHMAQSARDGFSARPRSVYGRAGEPCRRCGAPVRGAGQGEQNRTTYWCPGCQR